MQPKTYVSLSIVDEGLEPEEVTRSTSITPTRVWRIGDIRPKTIIQEKDNGWILNSPLPPEVPLDEHLAYVVSVIEPNSQSLKTFTRQYDSTISCAIYFGESRPEIHFESPIIQQLAEFHLNLDIDVYCVE